MRDLAKLALGDDATPATEEKVRATLHAASLDGVDGLGIGPLRRREANGIG